MIKNLNSYNKNLLDNVSILPSDYRKKEESPVDLEGVMFQKTIISTLSEHDMIE